MSSKGMYIVGIIGFIMLMVSTTLIEAFDTVYLGYVAFLIAWVLVCVGVVLGSFTFLGFYRYFGSTLSLIVFILSLVFPWFLLSSIIVEFIIGYSMISMILFLLGLLFFGVLLLLWGSVFFLLRTKFRQPEVNLVASIFLVLSSGYFLRLYLYVSFFYMIPACLFSIFALASSDLLK